LRRRLLGIALSLALLGSLAGLFGLAAPSPALAAGGSLTIEGPGLNLQDPDGDGTPGVTISQYQLRGTEALPPELQSVCGWVYLPQHDELYSTINTWPTKNFYRGKGVKLTDLLKLAGGLDEQATLIKFIASDGFTTTFTVRELVYEPRYRYPNFMYDEHGNWSQAGHIIGDASGAVPVEPMIAWKSGSSPHPEELSDDENLSTADANHLLYGQRAVTQQTNARFAKYTTTIQVLTDPVQKWGNPTASVPPGEVAVGTKVELHSPYDDEDKVHYTLDGSDPTIHSPMYNWIASRWWSSRPDVLDEINRPIEITQDTTIKAFVTGPGREDSDIVTFEYTVPRVAVTGVSIAQGEQVELGVGQTLPLTAVVQPENATNKAVTWSSSNAAVATVDQTGLVTGVSAGTATITVTTQDGGFTDSITVAVVPTKPAPALTPDATDNRVGSPIELVFEDDEAWRAAIREITVDGSPLGADRYSVEAGKITIAATVFSAAGDYRIVVKADGYGDATVSQTINPASGQEPGGKVVLTVTGPGVNGTKEFTQAELEEMPQYEHSCNPVR
jgi:chitodextrinase